MEMGIDHPFHVLGQEPGRGECVLQLGGAFETLVLDPVDIEKLGVFLIAECGIDQDQAIGVFHQDAAHGEGNAVPLVRLDARAP